MCCHCFYLYVLVGLASQDSFIHEKEDEWAMGDCSDNNAFNIFNLRCKGVNPWNKINSTSIFSRFYQKRKK